MRNCNTESWEKFDPVPTDIAVCLSIFIFPALQFPQPEKNSLFWALFSFSLQWILWSDNLCKTCSHAVEFLTLSIACFEFPPFLFYNHSDIKKYIQLFTTINPATIGNNAMQERIYRKRREKWNEKSVKSPSVNFKFSCWWYSGSSLNGGFSHFLWRDERKRFCFNVSLSLPSATTEIWFTWHNLHTPPPPAHFTEKHKWVLL